MCNGSIALDKYTKYLKQLLLTAAYFSSLISVLEQLQVKNPKPQQPYVEWQASVLQLFSIACHRQMYKSKNITNIIEKNWFKILSNYSYCNGKKHFFQLLFLMLLKKCTWENTYQMY